jgi:hydrogenase nickel incorporation protein HypA/HybF
MHELSIAEALLDVALEHAEGRRVARVEVRVGQLRQVVPDALEFAFQMVSSGTAGEGAELAMEVCPALARCRECGSEAPLRSFPWRCPGCDGSWPEVVGGEELELQAIEVTDEELDMEVVR